MKLYLPLVALLTLIPTPLILKPVVAVETQLVASEIEPELKEYARSISTKVKSDNKNNGSEVIIAKQGDKYLVITNNHVIQSGESLTVQTTDGANYQANQQFSRDRVSFYCSAISKPETGETIPATLAYVPQRKASVSIIGWKTHIPKWDAQKRCETVSPQFQTFYEDGRLNYLTTGVNNGYDIICAALEEGQPCKPEDQLFQVKASSNPKGVLRDLTGIIEGTVSEPIYQSSGSRIYVSMEELLNAAPVVEEQNSTSHLNQNKNATHKTFDDFK